jgi:hypothetical protein
MIDQTVIGFMCGPGSPTGLAASGLKKRLYCSLSVTRQTLGLFFWNVTAGFQRGFSGLRHRAAKAAGDTSA